MREADRARFGATGRKGTSVIKELVLRNFRGFSHHDLPLRPLTVIVGRNNAGKSTIAEALRLLSVITARYRSLDFHDVPNWLEAPIGERGLKPSLRNLEIEFANLFNQYNDPPAVIEARFASGAAVKIYLGSDERVHGVITNERGKIVKCRKDAQSASLPKVSIMPQVGPLLRDERVLSSPYIRAAASSALASLHFRNQLRVYGSLFGQFKALSEETWPALQIDELVGASGGLGERLSLLVRDREFVGEVSAMGHGLQVWLQTIWFLVREADSQTAILDEPDVYLHADLQRRLIRLLKGKFPQCIVTTHSTEIMAEVDPEDILIVDRRRERSQFANTLPSVQRVLQSMGSSQNVHLTRLWHSRRFMLVEGKDLRILKAFQDKLFPDSSEPIDAIPNVSVGGWGGWSYALGSGMTLKNAFGEDITAYCILDSDYHCTEEISERQKAAARVAIQLHIWTRKEIENYLLVPTAISRLLASRLRGEHATPSAGEIEARLDGLAQEAEQEVLDTLATELHARDKGHGVKTAIARAREMVASRKDSGEGLTSMVSGKALISGLSQWSQEEFGVALSVHAILNEINLGEVPSEMTQVLTAIERCQPFET